MPCIQLVRHYSAKVPFVHPHLHFLLHLGKYKVKIRPLFIQYISCCNTKGMAGTLPPFKCECCVKGIATVSSYCSRPQDNVTTCLVTKSCHGKVFCLDSSLTSMEQNAHTYYTMFGVAVITHTRHTGLCCTLNVGQNDGHECGAE